MVLLQLGLPKNAASGSVINARSPIVLVVETDRGIQKLLRRVLCDYGYRTIVASNGRAALALLQTKPDLIILELQLADIEGVDLIRSIRITLESVPIIVLSNLGDERSKVEALDLGADEFLTKPFGMEELLARMRSALRRQIPARGERTAFRAGQLYVDLVHRTVKVSDTLISLPPKEYDLLRLLVEHAGKVLTHRFLIGELWDIPVDHQYLRVYVRQLRQKIEIQTNRPEYITTQFGIGYRLRPPDTQQDEH